MWERNQSFVGKYKVTVRSVVLVILYMVGWLKNPATNTRIFYCYISSERITVAFYRRSLTAKWLLPVFCIHLREFKWSCEFCINSGFVFWFPAVFEHFHPLFRLPLFTASKNSCMPDYQALSTFGTFPSKQFANHCFQPVKTYNQKVLFREEMSKTRESFVGVSLGCVYSLLPVQY